MKLRKSARVAVIAMLGVLSVSGVAWAQSGGPAGSLHIPVADDPTARALAQKVQSIVIDKVDFDHLGIADVLQVLTAKSKALDPDKTGINFVLIDPTPQSHPPYTVTMQLENVPLDALLDLIGQQTGLRFQVEAYAVSCRP
jgi:hypothetical protein